MLHLGYYNTSGTRTHVRFQFSTHAQAGANVAPLTAFEAADIRIYKATDGAAFAATQRSSSAGITMTSPFDSLVGLHDLDIDLTDNTDASFYVAGLYSIVLAPDSETIDGQTITGVVLALFEIGPQAVNTVQISGDATAADTMELFAEALDQSTGQIDSGTFAASAINAAALDPDAGTEIANAVWGTSLDLSDGGTATAEALVVGAFEGIVAAGGTVDDASASTTGFDTTLTEADNFWNDAILTFTSGALKGQSRPITSYVQSSGAITFDEALTSAPANGVTFRVQVSHVHPVSQIADGVWDEARAGHVSAGTFGAGVEVATKTGFGLASDGLDSISTTAPAGVASNFREMLVQTWRRFFKRVTKDSDEIKTYADNGTSVLTTQTYTSSDPDDDVSAAT